MSGRTVSRRIFLMSTSVAAAGCATRRTRSLAQLGYESPNEKLNIAAIGAGGKGRSDTQSCRSENIVALCDVDWDRAAVTFERLPKAA